MGRQCFRHKRSRAWPPSSAFPAARTRLHVVVPKPSDATSIEGAFSLPVIFLRSIGRKRYRELFALSHQTGGIHGLERRPGIQEPDMIEHKDQRGNRL